MKVAHQTSARRVAKILVALDDGKQVAMSNRRLSELVGVTERSVRRALGALADTGAIDVVQVSNMDKVCGYRRLVPHREQLEEILAGALVSVAGATSVEVTVEETRPAAEQHNCSAACRCDSDL